MTTKRRVVTIFQRYLLNPVTRPLFGYLPGMVLLETKGRRSGRPRRTPVGGRLEGDTLWIVAEHGRRANYVRNIEADAAVRARIRGRWRTGRASVLPSDDPRKRLRLTPNDLMVRLVGTDLLTVRIDLDPAASRAARA
jgi:deazaflavin-dependent oxidoreductase (nitroreductase family)